MPTSEFDADTTVTRTGDRGFAATLSARWSIGEVASGGYLLAVACRALAAELGRDDPITVTAHFLSPATSGPATVEVEPLRSGRLVASGQARLLQDGRERVRVLGAFGTADETGARLALAGDGPPELPSPDACPTGASATAGAATPPIIERFDLHYHPGTLGWLHDAPGGRAEVGAWVRLRDGRPPDTLLLPVVVDVLPPAVFDLGYRGWVATLELTVHIRGRPAPGWLRCWTRSRLVSDELVEEDAEVWDARDRLVAMSRQLARLPRNQG